LVSIYPLITLLYNSVINVFLKPKLINNRNLHVNGGRGVKRLKIAKSKKSYAKKRNPWILDILKDSRLIADINYDPDYLVTRSSRKGICAICKGSKFLCGKRRCPIIVRVNSLVRTAPLISNTEIEGASPPSVFVGRIGYPYVYAGPLVPPIREDTSMFDIPELSFGKPIDENVHFYSMLLRVQH